MKKCVVLAMSIVILIVSAAPVCAATNSRPICSHDRKHVRTEQAIIFKAERVPGRLTDCPELWHRKYVVLNRAITTDGNIWLFYTSYNKKSVRQRRWKAVMLKIHDNYTKTILDDEVVDVIEYRYYSTLRPIGPGTCPDNFTEFENYDFRKYVFIINREAWGWVEYEKPLDRPEKYDLVAENNESSERGGIVVEYDNDLWDVVDIIGKKVLIADVWTGECKRSIPIDTFLYECVSRDA